MADKERIEQAIMAQILVAFGQGAGTHRVSRAACLALIDRYEPLAGQPSVHDIWDEEGVQALERIRAIGRLAAQMTTTDGRTTISAEDTSKSTVSVERKSRTKICSDWPPS